MKKIIFVLLSFVVFAACCQQKTADKPLVATEWHLLQLNGNDMELADNSFNITLAEDGSINGIAACNRLLGSYSVKDDNSLLFASLGTTMMLCPENGELENLFTQTLSTVAKYEIEGDKLQLLDSNDTVVAVFQALPTTVAQ